MRLLIDADGCPVVAQAIALARKYRVPCVLLCDTAHELVREGATTVTVSKGADSVDFALVNLLQAGDIAVTQDYGLAAMCMARCALALNQNGLIFTGENIDALLTQRHAAAKLRRAGGRLKGPAKRTPQQDESFCKALETLLAQKTAEDANSGRNKEMETEDQIE